MHFKQHDINKDAFLIVYLETYFNLHFISVDNLKLTQKTF